MAGALTGVRVIEFAQYMQGPWCAQLLGDMGADVVKIESPRGDGARSPGAVPVEGDNLFFLAMNRNKRSIVLDLKDEAGLEAARRLLYGADVVVENFRPGVMERLGLGYESLRELNPRLVFASATGWGRSGPLVDRPGQDMLAQAFSGAMSVGGSADDPPAPAGMFVADGVGSMLLALAILAALYARESTGVGQRVETSLLQALVHLQTQELVTYMNTAVAPRRGPNGGHAYMEGPYGTYRAADGHLVLANQPLDLLGEAIGLPHLADGFGDTTDVWHRRDELRAAIAPVIASRPVADWVERFAELDLPCAPVQDYDELIAHPQLAEIGMVEEIEHPDWNPLRLTGIPIGMSANSPAIRRPPPRLGEHTREILSEIGYGDSEQEELVRAAAK